MLHNGRVYWPTTFKKTTYPKIESYQICDVLVVGGGMSGALSAFRMAQAGYETILIDAQEIGNESTAANTGLLQYMSDKSFTECIKDFGETKAYQFYRDAYEGLNDIRHLCQMLPEDVAFKNRESILYPSKKKDEKFLKQEYINLRKYAFPCELLEGDQLIDYEINARIALLTYEDAEINPYIFVNRLLEYAVEHFDLKIFEHSKLTSWKADKEVIAKINLSKTLRSKSMIYAGGYADNEFTQLIKRNRFVSTFAIVSKPLKRPLCKKSMYWETARPYLYWRSTVDNRIIVGGLDARTKRIPSQKKIKKNAEKLKKAFKKQIKNHDIDIDVSYGARFAETKDGLPFIGEHPHHPNVYMLLGYGGNGTVYSSFGSKMILNLIQGQRKSHFEIYRPDR